MEIDGDQMWGTICTSLWLSMADGLPYGVMDPTRAYTVSWAQVTWGEDTGHVYIERSNLAGASPR